MLDEMRRAGIGETPGETLRQADRLVRGSELQGTRVRRDRPAPKIRNDIASGYRSRSHPAWLHSVCIG